MLRSRVGFLPQEIMQHHATNFFNKNNRNLTWNPEQAQTEPKLNNETTNIEFEQII